MPNPSKIEYQSPVIREDDGDEFKIEFDFDESLRQFFSIEFSSSTSRVNLEVDASRISAETDLGSHRISISVID